MQKIAIRNYMPFPIHVTVVIFPPATLRFILSRRQVPVPTGKVVAREIVQTAQGIITGPVDKFSQITFMQQGLGKEILLTRRNLTDDNSTEIVECTIHKPEARKDN